MINATRTPAKPITLAAARFLWIAFLCAACGMVAIAHVVKPEPHAPPNAMIGRMFAVLAAAEVLIFAFIRRQILSQARERKQRGETEKSQAAWGLAQIFSYAGAMSIVLFGFVLHLLNAQPAWISTALFAAGLLNLAVYYPQPLPESR